MYRSRNRGRNRREFLRSCCALGAAGVASQLARFGLVTSHAQTASDYKALVCVFFFGGNDSNNMIVPIDSRFNSYQTMRGPVALASDVLLPAGTSGVGAASRADQRSAALQPAAGRPGLQRRHARAADDERHARQHRAAAEPVLAFGSDAAVAKLRPERRRHRMGRPHQRRHRRDEHRCAPAGHHRQRRQRAVSLRTGHQGR